MARGYMIVTARTKVECTKVACREHFESRALPIMLLIPSDAAQSVLLNALDDSATDTSLRMPATPNPHAHKCALSLPDNDVRRHLLPMLIKFMIVTRGRNILRRD
jgi:hypothetical protein